MILSAEFTTLQPSEKNYFRFVVTSDRRLDVLMEPFVGLKLIKGKDYTKHNF